MNQKLLAELEQQLQQIERIPPSRPDEQDSAFQQMLDHVASAAGIDSAEYGLALRARASVFRNRGDTGRAFGEYTVALERMELGGDALRIQAIETRITVAGLQLRLGRADDAAITSHRVIELIAQYAADPQRYLPPGHPAAHDPEAAANAARMAASWAQRLARTLTSSAQAPDEAAINLGLSVYNDLIEKLSGNALCCLMLLFVRGGFELGHGKPSLATLHRAWELVHASNSIEDRLDADDLCNMSHLAIGCGELKKASECADRIGSLTGAAEADLLQNSYKSAQLHAEIAQAGGDTVAIEAEFKRLCNFTLAAFGGKSDAFLEAQAHLGRFLVLQGRSSEALKGFEHIAGIRLHSCAYGDVRAADALFDLAWCLDRNDQDIESIEYYGAAYERYEHTLGPYDEKSIEAASNLAETARVVHDYETAERWFRLALAALRQSRHDRTEQAALVINNLAETLLATGNTEEAASLAEEALHVRAVLFGIDSPKYKRSRGVVIRAALARGDLQGVKAILTQWKEVSSSGQIEMTIENIVTWYELNGDIEQAIDFCRKGLHQLAASGTKNDAPLLPGEGRDLLFRLGRLNAKLGNWSAARESLLQALQAEIAYISDECGHRSRRQIRLLLNESRSRMQQVLLVLASDPETTPQHLEAAYTVLQQRKAVETRLLRLQKPSFVTNPALTTIDPSEDWFEKARAGMEDLVDALRVARRRWMWAILQREQQHQSVAPDPELLRLQDQVENIERRLAGYVGQGARDMELFGVAAGIPSVPANSAVIEYCLAPDTADGAAPAYYAFVLRQEGSMHLRSLGDAASIHQATQQLRAHIVEGAPEPGNPDPRWKRRARFLSNRLLMPLLELLDGCEQLYIVPDAELFTLPFDLLPVGETDLVIDRWTTIHLWNGGELASFNMILGSPVQPSQPLVVSAPAMGDVSAPATWKFAHLPSAEEEGSDIAALTGALHLQQEEAAKQNILRHSGPEILHLATHSFYIPRQIPEGPSPFRAVPDTLLYRARATLDDPMERSGIALAGCNAELNTPTESSAGILFASEVLDLDLRGTDLTVLSSCQSGLGDSQPGDGIQGLRRAFRAAGSKSVVSSLWKVPDETTRSFMAVFYRHLLDEMPRGQAMREARLAMREAHQGDPLMWAAFVLDGDDRPLSRFDAMHTLRVANVTGIGLTYDAALEHLEKQEWDEAIHDLETVIGSRTANIRLRSKARNMRGYALRNAGQVEAARDAYSEVIQNIDTPEDLRRDALMGRAICDQMTGNYDQARLDYTALIEALGVEDEKRAAVLVNRSTVFMNLAQWQKALDDCDEVLANPSSPAVQQWKALLNRAETCRLQHDYAAALEDLKKVIHTSEANGTAEQRRAILIRALCRNGQRNFQQALAEIRLFLKAPPDAPPRSIVSRLRKFQNRIEQGSVEGLQAEIERYVARLLSLIG